MIPKIIICLLISALITLVAIIFLHILNKKKVKYSSIILLGTCTYAAIASCRELGIIWRILFKSGFTTKAHVIGALFACIIIFWLPSIVVILYRKKKISKTTILDELEIMKIKEM